MPPNLTNLLRHLSPTARMERRQRIHAMADRWAERLRAKHGEKAAYRCRRHQVATAKVGGGLRNHIWCQVAHRLKSEPKR